MRPMNYLSSFLFISLATYIYIPTYIPTYLYPNIAYTYLPTYTYIPFYLLISLSNYITIHISLIISIYLSIYLHLSVTTPGAGIGLVKVSGEKAKENGAIFDYLLKKRTTISQLFRNKYQLKLGSKYGQFS